MINTFSFIHVIVIATISPAPKICSVKKTDKLKQKFKLLSKLVY